MAAPSAGVPVLVAVDFSAHSEAALVWAVGAARSFRAPLVVLHVVHDPAGEPGYYLKVRDETGEAAPTPPLQRIELAAKERMSEFLAEARARHPDVVLPNDITTRLVVGIPVSRILEVADETGAHLIVVGSRGRTGISHLLLGSKAEQVARLSTVPVTIVKS